MRRSINLYFGLIFAVIGVMLGFWFNAHHPNNISLEKVIFEKDPWFFKSLEQFYLYMGCAVFLSGVGIIGVIESLFKSDAKVDTPKEQVDTSKDDGDYRFPKFWRW